jgi:hypothetical protein
MEKEIFRLENEIRGWSIVVSKLNKDNAHVHLLKFAAKEVSVRVKKVNKLKKKLSNWKCRILCK